MKLLRYLPRFQQAARQLDELAARETWSRGEIEAFQLDRLNAVWRHVAVHTPHYRQLRAELHLPEQFSSLDQFRHRVPLLAKSQVARDPRSFLSQRAPRGEWYRTSGSTGTPLSIYHSHDAHCEMLRPRHRLYVMWGNDFLARMVWLWNTHDTSAPGIVGHLKRTSQPALDWMRNRLRLSAHRLGPDDLRDHLRRIAAFCPSAMYGLSRAIWLLALEAKATGFHCESLKFVSLTGETTPSTLVSAVESGFGVPALVEYGSVEVPCVANEWPDRTLRVREDFVLLETIARAEGVFEIILTVLTNPSFALLRYRIGDLTAAPLVSPAVGFGILANVTGRHDDLVQSKSGRCLHPMSIDCVFESDTGIPIRRYQVHQFSSGVIRAAIEVNASPSNEAIRRLEEKICRLVDGYPVTVEVVETIPQTAAGKHRLITSDVRPLHDDHPVH